MGPPRLFTHPSGTDVGVFALFASVTRAAMICVFQCLSRVLFSVRLGVDLGVDFLGPKVTLGLPSWGPARLFSAAVAPVYIPGCLGSFDSELL